MKLYYTSVTAENNPQTMTILSLGGFRSSTIVTNADYNNLFGDVSVYSVQTLKDEYIALMLRNETGVTATNIRLWINTPVGANYSIQVGATLPNANNQIENIASHYSRPMTPTFVSVEGEVNAVNLGSLTNNAMIGLWFRKIINVQTVENQESDEYLINYYEANKKNPEPSIQDIDIVIDWS